MLSEGRGASGGMIRERSPMGIDERRRLVEAASAML